MSNQPWHQHYPENVPTEINPDKYESLLEMLHEIFEKYGPLPAFKNMDKTISYQELDAYSTAFAAWLQSKGFVKGDRIAIQMPNLLQYPVALFGAIKAGSLIPNQSLDCKIFAHKLRLLSVAPLETPVVPPVYWRKATSD